ncbi:hypothetical protein [Acetobacter indonesiensis]|uniref:hypothetical protein n=1 Tax=Acetobacter indonesiensis TaxID=104101 RepID=UPI0015C4FC3F|nr:hypothetical protein [Acetobacter indonesiensis]
MIPAVQNAEHAQIDENAGKKQNPTVNGQQTHQQKKEAKQQTATPQGQDFPGEITRFLRLQYSLTAR